MNILALNGGSSSFKFGLYCVDASCVQTLLHMPVALALIRFAQQHFPGLPQVACFDTRFHAGLPEVARVLPIA